MDIKELKEVIDQNKVECDTDWHTYNQAYLDCLYDYDVIDLDTFEKGIAYNNKISKI